METRIKMADGFDAIIDLEGVAPREASVWEQKFGYIGDVFYIYRTDRETPIVCEAKKVAWIHASEADKNGKLDKFGMELGELYFQYNFAKGVWEFDSIMNPNIMRYNIMFDEFFVERSTAYEAKEAARYYNGTVYTKNGQFVYLASYPGVC